MKLPLIHIKDYLLAVDNSNYYYDEYYLNKVDMQIYKSGSHLPTVGGIWHKKITHHLPLNNAPILKGVQILPPLEDVEELAKQNWENVHTKKPKLPTSFDTETKQYINETKPDTKNTPIPIVFVDGKFTQQELDTFPINFHKWDELVDKIDIYIPHLWGGNPMSADGCSKQTQLILLLTIAKKIELKKAMGVLEQILNKYY